MTERSLALSTWDSSTGKGEMTATKQISDARHLWRLSSYEDLEELGVAESLSFHRPPTICDSQLLQNYREGANKHSNLLMQQQNLWGVSSSYLSPQGFARNKK